MAMHDRVDKETAVNMYVWTYPTEENLQKKGWCTSTSPIILMNLENISERNWEKMIIYRMMDPFAWYGHKMQLSWHWTGIWTDPGWSRGGQRALLRGSCVPINVPVLPQGSNVWRSVLAVSWPTQRIYRKPHREQRPVGSELSLDSKPGPTPSFFPAQSPRDYMLRYQRPRRWGCSWPTWPFPKKEGWAELGCSWQRVESDALGSHIPAVPRGDSRDGPGQASHFPALTG